MRLIAVEIKSKILPRTGSFVVEIPAGTDVEQVLKLLGISAFDEILVVFNGRAAALSDEINEPGTLLLLPVLCGG